MAVIRCSVFGVRWAFFEYEYEYRFTEYEYEGILGV